MNIHIPGAAVARRLLAGLAVAGILVSPVLMAAPAYASSSADLTVTLTNKVDAQPGKRVAYRVVVHNNGPASASRVRIDFRTSAALKSITYKISSGSCYRSAKQTVCVLGRLRAGKTVTATISGVMPKKLKYGMLVTNRVSLASKTRLANRADDAATDNYRIGVPRTVPVPSPLSALPGGNKLAAITSEASKLFGYSRTVATITFAVLAAAIAWFAVGLTVHHVRARIHRY